MTKHEYLTALEKAMIRLNEAEREAALSFCEEMIDDRMEMGLTEEAAVAAMDEPAAMAEKLAVDIKQSTTQPAAEAQPLSNVWQKMVLRCDAAGLNHIDLQTRNMPMKVVPATDGRVTLTYFTRAQNVHEAKVEGNTLSLREIISNKEHRLFSFFTGAACREGVTLEMPADTMVNLTMQTKNGGMSLENMNMLMHISLHTSNGGLSVKSTRCISAEIATTNGGLALSDVESKQSLDAGTTNGGVAVRNCRCPGEIALHTTNGGMAVEDCIAGGKLTITSTNGGMKVKRINGSAVTLATSNAAITGALPGPQSQWQIESHTSNSHNSLPIDQPGEKPLNVHTSNAPIKIWFE